MHRLIWIFSACTCDFVGFVMPKFVHKLWQSYKEWRTSFDLHVAVSCAIIVEFALLLYIVRKTCLTMRNYMTRYTRKMTRKFTKIYAPHDDGKHAERGKAEKVYVYFPNPVEQIRRVFDDNWRIIFVSSPLKHTLWVLIRILMSTHNVCFYGEISKIIL